MTEEQKNTLKTVLGLPILTPAEKAAARGLPRAQDPNGMQIDNNNNDELEVDPLTAPLLPGAMEEEFDLEDVDASGADRANRATMEDDDEDGIPAGAERMQCASQ
jgi:hypothetical protein